MVVAIGAGGSGEIPIETAAAAGGVVITAAGSHIRVSEIIGAVIQMEPAVDKIVIGSAASVDTLRSFEAHGVGHAVEEVATGADGAGKVQAGGRSTLSGYRILILGIGGEVGKGVEMVGNACDSVIV